MRLRRLLAPAGVCLSALLLLAGPAYASGGGGSGGGSGSGGGGGGGGGGTAPPSVPAIQTLPDSLTLTSGASEFVQFLVAQAPPPGGETMTVAASNPALTVPATVLVAPGVDEQFRFSANTVTVSTPVTVTLKIGTATASFTITVNPAATPTVAPVSLFPQVVAVGDTVSLDVELASTAPPGGVTLGVRSDSPLLTVPATVTIPAGQNQGPFTSVAGSVTTPTIVHVTETLGTQTSTGQVEIDPPRHLIAIGVSPDPTDASQSTEGGVSVSVPAATSSSVIITLHSSNPAVAAVPPAVGLLAGQSGTAFPVTLASVTAPTTVTISATQGSVTLSTILTVVPTPPPPYAVQLLTLTPTSVAGNGTSTGTVTATTAAPPGGAVIKLSTSDTKLATVPASVTMPAGATTVTFPIKVTGSGATDISVGATFANLGHAAPLVVTGPKGGSVIAATTSNQVLETRAVNSAGDTLGFYGGGVASLESGQLPPGISLISNLRPGEFVFFGPPKQAGTYTFVLKFEGQGNPNPQPYAIAFVWVITAS